MYDLDKTQEWLNRTLQLNRTPPVRGGVPVDHRARRQTTISVLIACGILLLMILLVPRLRPIPTAPLADRSIVEAGDLSSRIVEAPAVAPAVSPASPYQPAPSSPASAFLSTRFKRAKQDAPVLRTPPPGYVAPHAPIWLDGPARPR